MSRYEVALSFTSSRPTDLVNSSVALPPLQLTKIDRHPLDDRGAPRPRLAGSFHPAESASQETDMESNYQSRSAYVSEPHRALSTGSKSDVDIRSERQGSGALPIPHSLPSLSEALGVEAPLPPYQSTPSGQVVAPPASRSTAPTSVHPSPTDTVSPRRAYPPQDYPRDGTQQSQLQLNARRQTPEFRRPEGYYTQSPHHTESSRLQRQPLDTRADPGPHYLSHQPSYAHDQRPWDAQSRSTDTRDTQDPSAYGDSVKRHLGIFDLEHALSDIVEHTTVISNFGHVYSARLHQSQRTGLSLGVLPAITEVDDLVNRANRTLHALTKARDVLITQHATRAPDLQPDERTTHGLVHGSRNDSMAFEDTKVDSSKRKKGVRRPSTALWFLLIAMQRQAQPGRCHSCNRAETPEWRRGPDGARTLCNACGLRKTSASDTCFFQN